jgi:putative transposase
VTVSGPVVLRVGDEVRIQGQLHTIDALAGGRVRLLDVTGMAHEVPLAQLFADPSVEPVANTTMAPLPPTGLLDNLPDEVVEQARWWDGTSSRC